MLNRLFSSFIRPVSKDNVAGTAKEQFSHIHNFFSIFKAPCLNASISF